MRPFTALLALALTLSHATVGTQSAGSPFAAAQSAMQAGAPMRPPLRASLVVGGERISVSMGEPTALADGTPVSVTLLPTRVFNAGGLATAEVPREWRHEGNAGAAGWYWSASGDGLAVNVRKRAEEPAVALAAYLDGVQGGTARDVTAMEVELDGRLFRGMRGRARGFSLHGQEAPDWIIEAVAFAAPDGSSWIIAFHRQLPVSTVVWGVILERIEQGIEGYEIQTTPPVTQVYDPGSVTLEAVIQSWRWQ